ncbi:MAG TPA: hypothetical protein DEA08_07135 [Planctomycetes bacterium]|nr:hypothetical protein [Planctomycetota bacterium]
MIPLTPPANSDPTRNSCPQSLVDLSSSGEGWDELYHQLMVSETNERTRRTWRLGATLELLGDLEL